MLGRPLQLIIKLGNGQAGTPRARCPKYKAGIVERRLCSRVTPKSPTALNCVHASGSEGLGEAGRGKQGAALACDQVDAETKPPFFWPFGTSRGASGPREPV